MDYAYKCAICGWGIFTNKELEVKYCPKAGCGALIFKNTPKRGLRNANFQYRNDTVIE